MNRLISPIAITLLFLATMMQGCADDPRQGWSTTSIYPTQYKTIAVNVFKNDTYSRNVGFMLTQAVITTIESQTPYKVTSENNADTLLTGRIVNVNLTSLSQNESTGLDEEVIVGDELGRRGLRLELVRLVPHLAVELSDDGLVLRDDADVRAAADGAGVLDRRDRDARGDDSLEHLVEHLC